MDPMNPPALNSDEPPFVGLKEAARLAGVSLSTAKRRRSELIAAGAEQETSGRWRIPRTAVAVLAEPPVHPGVEPPSEPPQAETTTAAPAGDAEVSRLREELHTMEVRAVRAEAQAEERQRALEAAQEQVRAYLQLEAMRGLTAAREHQEPEHEEADTPVEDVPATEESTVTPWKRLRGLFGRRTR